MDQHKKKLTMVLLWICMLSLLTLDAPNDNTSIFLAFEQWLQAQTILLNLLLDRKRCNRSVWKHVRAQGFVEKQLLGSYNNKLFKQRLRVSRETFMFICTQVAPYLKKQDTKMRKAIPVESRVCIALSRLATGSSLIVLSDLFGVGVSTCHEITIEFSRALKKALHSKCIKWPNPARMHTLALDFEDIKGIPNVVGAVDGSHIPIIAPKRHPQDYYNRKGFHSTLLQLVVSARCLIWDYDVGWPGSIHDWNLFQKSSMGKRCANGDLGDYYLVGDAAYPPRVWMLSPYKGHKDGLSQVEYQWNFAQSSTRMAMERGFGILKSRWRILLKRIDMKFEYVLALSWLV